MIPMKTIYMDNGASSFPKAPGVGTAMQKYIDEIGANINRGSYGTAVAAASVVLETRTKLARLFGFGGAENHVVFVPGATIGINQILRGFLKPGDHVIVSSMEHNAVMRPLTELAKSGISFSRIPADSEGMSKASDILPLIRENTKLVMVSHASNVCGALFPLEEVAEICRERGIPLAVDAAQTAGHIDIDFDKMKLAALCVPGHKGLLGPQGIGALLLDKSFAAKLNPLFTGGTGSASDSELQPDYMPDKFESGTQNIPGIFGLHASLEFIEKTGIEKLRKHEIEMTDLLIKRLEGLPLRIVGPKDSRERVGVVSTDFRDIDNAIAAYRLESEYGILTRCGMHCAPSAHKSLGTFPQGTVRLSVGYNTSEEDVLYTAEAVRRLCE